MSDYKRFLKDIDPKAYPVFVEAVLASYSVTEGNVIYIPLKVFLDSHIERGLLLNRAARPYASKIATSIFEQFATEAQKADLTKRQSLPKLKATPTRVLAHFFGRGYSQNLIRETVEHYINSISVTGGVVCKNEVFDSKRNTNKAIKALLPFLEEKYGETFLNFTGYRTLIFDILENYLSNTDLSRIEEEKKKFFRSEGYWEGRKRQAVVLTGEELDRSLRSVEARELTRGMFAEAAGKIKSATGEGLSGKNPTTGKSLMPPRIRKDFV